MAKTEQTSIPTSIAPWLSVPNGASAVDFYKSAFNAAETYRLETPDGVIVRLSVDGAEFWISGGSADNSSSPPLGGDSIRMILIVADPYPIFEKALKAGATEVFPIGRSRLEAWAINRSFWASLGDWSSALIQEKVSWHIFLTSLHEENFTINSSGIVP